MEYFIQQQYESFKLRKRRPALDLLCLNCFCFFKILSMKLLISFPSSDMSYSVVAGSMSEQVMLQKKESVGLEKAGLFACYLKFAHKNNPSISDETISTNKMPVFQMVAIDVKQSSYFKTKEM